MIHSVFNSQASLQSTLEFVYQLKAVGLPTPVTELEFSPPRRWRFDLAWPKEKIALEIEGGIFKRKGATRCRTCGQTPAGRHVSGQGFLSDMEKYNKATALGWRLFRVTPQMISNGEALNLIEKVFQEM